ncbi:hypothetical protein [Glaciimonas sp. PAMC28666]|uniref:hypothetical protein n=1 Tax=Glaciimonas sp. PAMC28666 TaxID=2807626 RepID=UPI00196455CE|nr:hypothetical protein [Glaciimonas sp. PAMC28666]QRX83261.1 hypothetical protein JQN73_03000 [Glaciimonas sp. PAMC28666]
MRASVLNEILTRINAIDADETMRLQVTQIVLDVAMEHGVAGMARIDRVAYARRMLDARISRSTIRARLMAEYGLSRRSAYRAIDMALQTVP